MLLVLLGDYFRVELIFVVRTYRTPNTLVIQKVCDCVDEVKNTPSSDADRVAVGRFINTLLFRVTTKPIYEMGKIRRRDALSIPLSETMTVCI